MQDPRIKEILEKIREVKNARTKEEVRSAAERIDELIQELKMEEPKIGAGQRDE